MEKYYLWLLLAAGEGAPEITQLLRVHGTPEAAYNAFRNNTAPLGAEIAERAAKTTLESAEKLLTETGKLGIRIITIDSAAYPAQLKKQENPPCVLFAYGNTELLKGRLLTVVGSRKVTRHTQNTMPRLIHEIGSKYTIVSSLSEGCDQLTCLNALKNGVPFIEIMPCGITQTYPNGSRTLRRFLVQNGGLLLTEMLPKTRASNASFLRRSRIIGGISEVTLVLQAGEESGALKTAEYSKAPLFLPPGDPEAPEYAGTVAGIRAGCKMYYGLPDIEAAFRRAREAEKLPAPAHEKLTARTKQQKAVQPGAPAEKEDKKTAPPQAAPESAPGEQDFESDAHYRLYTVIRNADHALSAEELIALTGIEPAGISELLLDLELADRIENTHNRYTIK